LITCETINRKTLQNKHRIDDSLNKNSKCEQEAVAEIVDRTAAKQTSN